MANPPPPYANITGISRSVMKDNAQETVSDYNGNARPGELTMDLTTDPPTIYIGNNLGNLTQLTFGGTGNGIPGGPANSVQLNNGAGGFNGYANFTFNGTNAVTVLGNVNSTNVYASSNIVAAGNVTASYGIFSGGNTVINSTISTTGNILGNYFIGNGSQLTGLYGNSNVANYLPTFTGNITANIISATGNVYGNYGVFSGGNTVINNTISTTGNIIGGNISATGNVYANNIIGNTTYNGGYYGAFDSDYQTALNGGINSNSTAPIAVTSTSGWPATGALLIDQEFISYTGISGNTFTGITRGVAGSNGATHANGAAVSFAQVAAANTATTLVIDHTNLSSGVTLNASTHEVTIVNAGVYNCQFSVQTACADNAPDDIAVWFVVDGTAIPTSASYVTTQQIHAGHLGTAIMTVNIFYQFTAGQRLTLKWVTLAGTSAITSYPSVASPAIPASPAMILTVNQIG